jgi:hypothetical protein
MRDVAGWTAGCYAYQGCDTLPERRTSGMFDVKRRMKDNLAEAVPEKAKTCGA